MLLFKGVAWALSMGASAAARRFRPCSSGWPAGILIANVTGFPETPAIAIGMAAATVSTLRLPLSSVILATVVSQAGLAVAPLIIVAVVVAYIVTEELGARRGAPTAADAGAASTARRRRSTVERRPRTDGRDRRSEPAWASSRGPTLAIIAVLFALLVWDRLRRGRCSRAPSPRDASVREAGKGFALRSVTAVGSAFLNNTNTAAAVLLFPIMTGIVTSLGAPWQPFVVVLMLGCSYAFINPAGYQTHLMVMKPGGYTFIDFAKVGALLTTILAAVVVPLAYVLYRG